MASSTIKAKYPAQVVVLVTDETKSAAEGQAALEQVSTSAVLRRWIELGRAAERAGVDLDALAQVAAHDARLERA